MEKFRNIMLFCPHKSFDSLVSLFISEFWCFSLAPYRTLDLLLSSLTSCRCLTGQWKLGMRTQGARYVPHLHNCWDNRHSRPPMNCTRVPTWHHSLPAPTPGIPPGWPLIAWSPFPLELPNPGYLIQRTVFCPWGIDGVRSAGLRTRPPALQLSNRVCRWPWVEGPWRGPSAQLQFKLNSTWRGCGASRVWITSCLSQVRYAIFHS